MEPWIPSFDFTRVFLEPWTDTFESSVWIVLMGFLVACTCGLTGIFIILRRLSLMGDAISHSLLPGIVLGYLISGTRLSLPLFLGAVASGILSALLVEFLKKRTILKADAAMGIVFTSLFALGVVLIHLFADQVDLDTDCVLYGEIAFVPLQNFLHIGGIELAPFPVVLMGGLLAMILLVVLLFYKELLVSTFDPGLGRCMGVGPGVFLMGLMGVLSVVIVSSFRSVGVILVVAMLLFPGATAMLISSRLPRIIFISLILSLIYSFLGFHLAIWLNGSIAASIAVVGLLIFAFIWGYKLIKRLIQKEQALRI